MEGAMKERNIVVVGATGLVGRTILEVLKDRAFPVGSLRCVASPASAGGTLTVRGEEHRMEALSEEVFLGADVTFFAVREPISREWAPVAARHSLVIDNSSAWRMHPEAPLVVPEVNGHMVFQTPRNIIANPNCSTIQMVVALKPLHDAWRVKRVVVSTYQAVSGAGQRGSRQLDMERRGEDGPLPAFPHPVLDNALPHIAGFEDDGYTREERKMILETRKIMGDDSILVAPTCVRIPVPNCHSEAVFVEFEQPSDPAEAARLLAAMPGVVVLDDPASNTYPLATTANGRDEVFVGRIRRDPTVPSGLVLWVVADNLRKGAAANAVQIAEVWAAGVEQAMAV